MRAFALVIGLVLSACSKPEAPSAAADAAPAPLGPASVSVAPPPSAPAAKQEAWYVGKWSGTYDAQHYLIEAPKNEGAREWGQDDGGAHSGSGTIELSVGADGRVSGTADGPLGRQTASGEVDADTLRVSLAPDKPGERSFSGVVVLSRKGDKIEGRLQASTGDSRTVRDAAVTLEKGKPAAPASSR